MRRPDTYDHDMAKDYVKSRWDDEQDAANYAKDCHKEYAHNELQQRWYEKAQKGKAPKNGLTIKPLTLKDGQVHYLNQYQRALYGQLDKALGVGVTAQNTPPMKEIEMVGGKAKAEKVFKQIKEDPSQLTPYDLGQEKRNVARDVQDAVDLYNDEQARQHKEENRPTDQNDYKLYDKKLADGQTHQLNANQIAAYYLFDNPDKVNTEKAPDVELTGHDAWGSYSDCNYYNGQVLKPFTFVDRDEEKMAMFGTNDLDTLDMTKLKPNPKADSVKTTDDLAKAVKREEQIKLDKADGKVLSFSLADGLDDLNSDDNLSI